MKKLSASDNNHFEAHLLECEQCFEDLSALDRTAGVLHQYLDEPPKGLPFAPNLLQRKRWPRALAVAASIMLLLFGGFLLKSLVGPTAEGLAPISLQTAAFSADLDDLAPELQALFFTARGLMFGDHPEQARELLNCAESCRGPLAPEFFQVLRERADLEAHLGDKDRAEKILKNAVGLAESVQNLQQLALARVLLAQLNFKFQLNDTKGNKVLVQAQEASDAADSLETAYLILEAQCNHALLVKGDYNAALEIAERALAKLEEPTPRALLLLATAHEAQAVASGTNGREHIALARQYADRARVLAEADNDKDDRANALAIEGRLDLLDGGVDSAVRKLAASVAIFGEFCLSFDSLNARLNLAHAYLRKNQIAQAERVLEPIEKIALRMKMPYLTFDYHRLAGWVALRKKDEKKALAHFKSAEEVGRTLFSTWIRQTELTRVRTTLNTPEAPPKLPKNFSTGVY